jgi:hypothetical protein
LLLLSSLRLSGQDEAFLAHRWAFEFNEAQRLEKVDGELLEHMQ